MLHWNFINETSTGKTDRLLKKASGRYFTGEFVGRRLARIVCANLPKKTLSKPRLCILDPFGGDGRLVHWLIEELQKNRKFKGTVIQVELWDIDSSAFEMAKERFEALTTQSIEILVNYCVTDSFDYSIKITNKFDIVITNPPWETLKPERRDLSELPSDIQDTYIAKLRHYDLWLSKIYPLSQPEKKFAGWGTNLSRVGLELSISLTDRNGVLGVVMPASLLADGQSEKLRRSLFDQNRVIDIAYYPAEAKLYEKADVESVTVVAQVGAKFNPSVALATYDNVSDEMTTSLLTLAQSTMDQNHYVLPIRLSSSAAKLMDQIASRFQPWRTWEENKSLGFWAGREIDETGIARFLETGQGNDLLFIKGKMIDRFQIRDSPQQSVKKPNWTTPLSVSFPRLVWRDVSRPNQKRRVIATLIPMGWVAGNSLGVAYLRSGNTDHLKSILGIMSSTVFEVQLRAHLATGHLSLGSIRKVAVPYWSAIQEDRHLPLLTQSCLESVTNAEFNLDAYVAKRLYYLSYEEYMEILKMFPKISTEELLMMETAFKNIEAAPSNEEEHHRRIHKKHFCLRRKPSL